MMSLPKKTALMVIDVQEAWLDPKWGARNNPEAEQNIAALLSAWRETGRPIVHVRHISLAPESIFAFDSPGSKIQRIAAPRADETIVEKHHNSSFIGTDLEQRLRREGIGHVVIVGMTTDQCVSTAARMAGNLEFITYLVADATATFDRIGPDGVRFDAKVVHDVNLASVHTEFATVVTTAQILESVVGAGREEVVNSA